MTSKDFTTKICTGCKEEKPLINFHKHKRARDGFINKCKSCRKVYMDAYKRTKRGLSAKIHGQQVSSSKKRWHQPPNYTSDELFSWMNQQINFDCLYLNWINSGYNKLKTPSCDRLDDYKPYTLGNIQLTTWQDNHGKWCSDAKNGINNKNSKTVNRLSLDNEFIETYYSANQAAREIGINKRNINACCRGERNTAGGFKWCFA